MDITFNCDKCGQYIGIGGAAAGQLVDCPKCGTPLEVPYKSQAAPPMPAKPPEPPPAPAPAPNQTGLKKCPFCAEMIKAEARICRFCRSSLEKVGAELPISATPIQSGSGGTMICPNPNCGYHGNPRREPKGDVFYGILLCLLCLLPGIIYFIVQSGYKYVCPKCGLIWQKDLIA
jgi:hypothetical protein